MSSDATDVFTVRVRAGRSTDIALRGELDLATVQRFEAVFDSIDFSSVACVVLDLGELSFMDLSGLRAVLKLRARCVEHAVELAISPGPRAVQRLFELTHTLSLLPFDQSRSPRRQT